MVAPYLKNSRFVLEDAKRGKVLTAFLWDMVPPYNSKFWETEHLNGLSAAGQDFLNQFISDYEKEKSNE
jgi:hypothetical protein